MTAGERGRSYLLLSPLLLGRHHVVALVLLDGAQNADAHLVRLAEELQALLMLGADLPVQVADLVHQLVPLEGGRLVVGLQVLVAVRRQAHEARLDCLVLLAHADVAAHVLGPRVTAIATTTTIATTSIIVRGRRRGREGFGGRSRGQGGVARAADAARRGPLVVGDPALGAEEGAGRVGVVPVGLQADGAEDVSTRDGHGVPEGLLTQVAAVLVHRGDGRIRGFVSAGGLCFPMQSERASVGGVCP